METWDRVYEMYQKVGDLFICTINRIYTACQRSLVLYPSSYRTRNLEMSRTQSDWHTIQQCL